MQPHSMRASQMHALTYIQTHTHTRTQRQWWCRVSMQVTLSVGWEAPAPCLQISPAPLLPDPPRWFRRMSCRATTTCPNTRILWVLFCLLHTLSHMFNDLSGFYPEAFSVIFSLSSSCHGTLVYSILLRLFISFNISGHSVLGKLRILGLWQDKIRWSKLYWHCTAEIHLLQQLNSK